MSLGVLFLYSYVDIYVNVTRHSPLSNINLNIDYNILRLIDRLQMGW